MVKNLDVKTTRYREYTNEIANTIASSVNSVLKENKLSHFLYPLKGFLFNNRNMYFNVILTDYEKKISETKNYNRNIYEYIWDSRYDYFSGDTIKSRNIFISVDKSSSIGEIAEEQLKNWIIKKGYIAEDFIEYTKGGIADKAGIDFKLKVNNEIIKIQVKKGFLKSELIYVDMIESDSDLIRGSKEYDIIAFVLPDKYSDLPKSVHFYKKPKTGLKNLDPRDGESSARWSLSKNLRWRLPNRVFNMN